MRHAVRNLGLLIGLAVFGVMLCSGVLDAWHQHDRISRASATVQATILSARIDDGTVGPSESAPVVRYQYAVGGRTYVGDRFEAHLLRRSHARVRNIVNRLLAEKVVEAYYDPESPQESLLSRRYEFGPYFFVLASLPFLSLLLVVAIGLMVRAARKAPFAPQAGEWYELGTKEPLGLVFWCWAALACLWHGLGPLVWGHYFAVADRPFARIGIAATVGYELVGLAPIAVALKYWSIRRNVKEARVFADRQEFRRGSDVVVRTEQVARSTLLLKQVVVGLTCRCKTRVQRGADSTEEETVCYQDWRTSFEDRRVNAGGIIATEQSFLVPEEQEQISPSGAKGYPRFRWQIELKTELGGRPDYKAAFPITVKPSS